MLVYVIHVLTMACVKKPKTLTYADADVDIMESIVNMLTNVPMEYVRTKQIANCSLKADINVDVKLALLVQIVTNL